MLCVIAKLDKRSTEKLTAIQKAAAPDADGKPLHGHITLAAYMGEDEAGFMAFCAALLKDVSRFSVKYTHLAVLEETSIVAALAEKTGTLAALHRRIAEVYGGSLNEWTGSEKCGCRIQRCCMIRRRICLPCAAKWRRTLRRLPPGSWA